MSKTTKIVSIALILGSIYMTASAETIITSETQNKSNLKVGKTQVVKWSTSDFPEKGFVNINLIKKTSESPAKYELVRKISEYSVNDGEESWVPEKSDVGENLYLEVTCAGAVRFPQGCRSITPTNTFAIEQGFGSNLASVYSAFIDFLSTIFK